MENKKEVQEEIDDLSYDVEKKLDKEEKKRCIKNLIGVAITIACAFGILALVTASLPIGLIMGLGLLGSLSAIKAKCGNDLSKAIIDRYNQELDHLERVEKDGIENSAKLEKARTERLTEIASQQPDLDDEVNKDRNISTIAAGITLGGAALAALISPWFTLPAIVAELISISYDIDALDKNDELQNLNNRIDNLNNDLKVTRTMNEVAEKEADEKAKAEKRKEIAKTSSTKTITVPTAIDTYVEGLANQPENTTPKRLEKKN